MTTPVDCPAWCDRKHPDDLPEHVGPVGVPVELSAGSTLAVWLSQTGHTAAEIVLVRHTSDRVTTTHLSILEAGIHRDAITEALDLVAREVGR